LVKLVAKQKRETLEALGIDEIATSIASLMFDSLIEKIQGAKADESMAALRERRVQTSSTKADANGYGDTDVVRKNIAHSHRKRRSSGTTTRAINAPPYSPDEDTQKKIFRMRLVDGFNMAQIAERIGDVSGDSMHRFFICSSHTSYEHFAQSIPKATQFRRRLCRL
jgi:hypothetical protein